MRREVESLIAAHEQGDSSFMERPVGGIREELKPGTKLGPYEIVALLGTGGMGEVYRAHDKRLGRDVAIKILPAEFSADSDRLQRFSREARSASALNHPNIVTIYELGQDGSTHYIAMELIEGKTLREMLLAGALPIRKAIEVATQIAEGLAKAHEAGIAHRDIKPANLMVTDDGFVKILDFRIGEASGRPAKNISDDADCCTGSQTRPGLIVGTPGYMSPEQAGGAAAGFPARINFRLAWCCTRWWRASGRSGETRRRKRWWQFSRSKRRTDRGAESGRARAALLGYRAMPGERSPTSVTCPLGIWRVNLPRYAIDSSERPIKQVGNSSGKYSGAADWICGARKGSGCREGTSAASGCAAGHDYGAGRNRQNAAGGGSGEWRGRAISRAGVHFVPLSPLNDPDLIVSVIVQTLGIPRDGRPVAAGNSEEGFAGLAAPTNAVSAGQFRAPGCGGAHGGGTSGDGSAISKFW